MPALASFLGLSTHRRTLSKPTEKLMDVEIEHAFFCLACLTFGGKQRLHPLPQFQWMGTSMVKMRREGIFSKSRQRSAIGVEKGQFQGENGNDFGLLDKSLFWNLFSIDRGSERWMDSSINHFSLSWTFFRPKGIAFSLRCGRLFPPYFFVLVHKVYLLGSGHKDTPPNFNWIFCITYTCFVWLPVYWGEEWGIFHGRVCSLRLVR